MDQRTRKELCEKVRSLMVLAKDPKNAEIRDILLKTADNVFKKIHEDMDKHIWTFADKLMLRMRCGTPPTTAKCNVTGDEIEKSTKYAFDILDSFPKEYHNLLKKFARTDWVFDVLTTTIHASDGWINSSRIPGYDEFQKKIEQFNSEIKKEDIKDI